MKQTIIEYLQTTEEDMTTEAAWQYEQALLNLYWDDSPEGCEKWEYFIKSNNIDVASMNGARDLDAWVQGYEP